MGGRGSGRWGWYTKKQTVEGCYRLRLFGLLDKDRWQLFGAGECFSGTLSWSWDGKWDGTPAASVGWALSDGETSAPMLTLFYKANDVRIIQSIRLKVIALPYGGRRYLLTCPRCTCGAQSLYMPPSSARFACRKCHGLAYDSQSEYFSTVGLPADLVQALKNRRRFFRVCRRRGLF